MLHTYAKRGVIRQRSVMWPWHYIPHCELRNCCWVESYVAWVLCHATQPLMARFYDNNGSRCRGGNAGTQLLCKFAALISWESALTQSFAFRLPTCKQKGYALQSQSQTQTQTHPHTQTQTQTQALKCTCTHTYKQRKQTMKRSHLGTRQACPACAPKVPHRAALSCDNVS